MTTYQRVAASCVGTGALGFLELGTSRESSDLRSSMCQSNVGPVKRNSFWISLSVLFRRRSRNACLLSVRAPHVWWWFIISYAAVPSIMKTKGKLACSSVIPGGGRKGGKDKGARETTSTAARITPTSLLSLSNKIAKFLNKNSAMIALVILKPLVNKERSPKGNI